VVGGDRWIVFDCQLELDLRRIGELPLELAELLLGVPPDRFADLDIAAFDLQSHRVSSVRWLQ
jgi:hypothetical protein